MICSNDAIIESYDFKYRADYRDTYSALWYVRTLALDLGRFSVRPGNDWDQSKLLKLPLSTILISSFLVTFSNFVLPLLAASNPCLVCLSFLMYYGMY